MPLYHSATQNDIGEARHFSLNHSKQVDQISHLPQNMLEIRHSGFCLAPTNSLTNHAPGKYYLYQPKAFKYADIFCHLSATQIPLFPPKDATCKQLISF